MNGHKRTSFNKTYLNIFAPQIRFIEPFADVNLSNYPSNPCMIHAPKGKLLFPQYKSTSMEKEENKIPSLDYETLATSNWGGMSDHIFAVSQVKYKKEGNTLCGNATGFFYMHKEQLYFITNRHVVIDKEFQPDKLILNLHIDKNDLTKNRVFPIPLYEGAEPTWLEHPNAAKNIDVVALPVEIPSTIYVTPFSREDFIIGRDRNIQSVHVPIGDDILIIGYPEGLYDSVHNTPIIRRGSLASVYPLPYQDKLQFLIDARLHNGTSGSPVLLKASRLTSLFYAGGRSVTEHPSKRYLIGIHSGPYDGNMENLNLHIAWFAELISQIVDSKRNVGCL